MADIEPKDPEAVLAASLPRMNVSPAQEGEMNPHVYHVDPPALGMTNMDARPDAIRALMMADLCSE